MPDIAMCNNKLCKSKKKCYRFTAKPNPFRQSYGSFKPEKGRDKCDFYYYNQKFNRGES